MKCLSISLRKDARLKWVNSFLLLILCKIQSVFHLFHALYCRIGELIKFLKNEPNIFRTCHFENFKMSVELFAHWLMFYAFVGVC